MAEHSVATIGGIVRSDANSGPVDVSASPHARLQPLAGTIDGGLWAERRRLNREVLLVEGARKLEEAGNFHNLRVAAGQEDGEFVGMRFADSDVYKWLEALGWELGHEPSDALAALAETATELVAAAQEPSGYLNSYFQVDQTETEHFVNLAWDHELYCAGHLIQAAVAHARGTGDTRLLDVARRLADHIGEVFGPGRNEGTPGHPEIETALVELHRLTGEPRTSSWRASWSTPAAARRSSPPGSARRTSRTTRRCARRPRWPATACASSTSTPA